VPEPLATPEAAVAVGCGSVVAVVSAGATVPPAAGVVDGGAAVAVRVTGGDVVCEAVCVTDCVVDPSGFVYWAQPAHEAALVAGTRSDALPAPTRTAPATTAAARRRRTPSTGRVKQPATRAASPGSGRAAAGDGFGCESEARKPGFCRIYCKAGSMAIGATGRVRVLVP
jgi:hypothetical protein